MNYEKVFGELSEAVARGSYDKLSQAGLIHIFKLAFELAWKTLKDKLEYDGLDVDSPRETLKMAFRNGCIQDGKLWIEALDNCDLLARTYDDTVSDEARDLIRGKYFFLLKDLHQFLEKESVLLSP